MKIAIFLIALLVQGNVNSATISPEDIFSQAEKYTLELSIDITEPFIYDETGSFVGTAFLIDKKKGWILTNAHVVGKSPSSIQGRFKSGEYHDIKKVYLDPVIDLAIIQIDPNNISDDALEAKLACEANPKIGHPVGTFGHPWQTEFTATRGIVSGTTHLRYDKWLQVDAPINSGNSGGALISMESGFVIGITSATGDEDTEGLGFALPISSVCTVLELLESNKNPSPPELGVVFFNHDDKNNKLKVADVIESNLDAEEGDIIESVGGHDVKDEFELIDLLRGKDEVSLTIDRKGERKDVVWKISPMPKVIGRKGVSFSGIIITPNDWQDRQETGNSNTWMIEDVADGTLAQSHIMEAMTFIKYFDGHTFLDIESLYSYLQDKDEKDDVYMVVKRFTGTPVRTYDYYEYEFGVRDLKIVTIE